MTNKEAIEELESLIEHCSSFVEHKHHEPWESDIEALKLGIEALKERPQGEWIPITYRPMTEEEEKEFCVKWGIEEGSLDDWDKRFFNCHLPDDGQEILISVGRYVHEDICSWDEGCCGLENNGDWDGVDAWMPKPEPYKKGEEE